MATKRSRSFTSSDFWRDKPPTFVKPHDADRTDGPVTVTVNGMRLLNTLNAREDWRVRMRREKAEKARVRMSMPTLRPRVPCVVTMTRFYSRRSKEMDDDGLAAAMKAPRDAVATWLGTDDSSRGGVTWRPVQCPSGTAENYLVIHVETKGGRP